MDKVGSNIQISVLWICFHKQLNNRKGYGYVPTLVKSAKTFSLGAGSVVTHDVGDYEVVAGTPAKVLKTLDAEKFTDKD